MYGRKAGGITLGAVALLAAALLSYWVGDLQAKAGDYAAEKTALEGMVEGLRERKRALDAEVESLTARRDRLGSEIDRLQPKADESRALAAAYEENERRARDAEEAAKRAEAGRREAEARRTEALKAKGACGSGRGRWTPRLRALRRGGTGWEAKSTVSSRKRTRAVRWPLRTKRTSAGPGTRKRPRSAPRRGGARRRPDGRRR